MPVDLREIASIAGMSGLFRIISPTRNGVVIESLSDNPVRSVAQAKHRLSLLNEISIYTNDPEVTAPLSDIFDTILSKHGQNIPVNAKSSNPELLGFMETILPDYDRERVYVSDIKKIVNWYGIVGKHLKFEAAPEPVSEKGKAKANGETKEGEEKPAAEKKTKPKAEASDKTDKADKPAKKTKDTEAADKPKAAAKKTKKSAE